MLAVPYSKFQVNSARWHSWSEEQRQDHVQRFRNYFSTPADFYPKPKNAGRKPGYATRKRREDPTVIFNRIEGDEEIHPAGSKSMSQVENVEQGLRFLDPRQVPKKAFELHLTKYLPRLIEKCQSMCGEVIRSNDDEMLAKSYGTSTWTDRKSRQEKSKFGLKYIYFNSQCLGTFDRENNNGPRKPFDYKKIQVDNKTQGKLTEAEKGFLIKTGIIFPSS